jgi:hypothetical protein
MNRNFGIRHLLLSFVVLLATVSSAFAFDPICGDWSADWISKLIPSAVSHLWTQPCPENPSGVPSPRQMVDLTEYLIRWQAIEAIAGHLPSENEDADPDFLKELGFNQAVNPLEDCEYEPDIVKYIDRLIGIFEKGNALPTGKSEYILNELNKLSELKYCQRLKLKLGARAAPDMALTGLTNHSCPAYLLGLFKNGATRQELLALIRRRFEAGPDRP